MRRFLVPKDWNKKETKFLSKVCSYEIFDIWPVDQYDHILDMTGKLKLEELEEKGYRGDKLFLRQGILNKIYHPSKELGKYSVTVSNTSFMLYDSEEPEKGDIIYKYSNKLLGFSKELVL